MNDVLVELPLTRAELELLKDAAVVYLDSCMPHSPVPGPKHTIKALQALIPRLDSLLGENRGR